MVDSVLVPTYEVKHPLALVSLTVEAPSEDAARREARAAWIAVAKQSAILAEVKRQPFAPDDTGDARSDRSEWNEGDVADDAAEAFRWGFTPDGREPEDSRS